MAVALLHLIAVPLALALKHFPPMPQEKMALILTMVGGFVLLLMISRGLILAVQALYARGDMDLMNERSLVTPLNVPPDQLPNSFLRSASRSHASIAETRPFIKKRNAVASGCRAPSAADPGA